MADSHGDYESIVVIVMVVGQVRSENVFVMDTQRRLGGFLFRVPPTAAGVDWFVMRS